MGLGKITCWWLNHWLLKLSLITFFSIWDDRLKIWKTSMSGKMLLRMLWHRHPMLLLWQDTVASSRMNWTMELMVHRTMYSVIMLYTFFNLFLFPWLVWIFSHGWATCLDHTCSEKQILIGAPRVIQKYLVSNKKYFYLFLLSKYSMHQSIKFLFQDVKDCQSLSIEYYKIRIKSCHK